MTDLLELLAQIQLTALGRERARRTDRREIMRDEPVRWAREHRPVPAAAGAAAARHPRPAGSTL